MTDMQQSLPMAVDLDGTLIKTDLLHESLLALARTHPLMLFLVPFWLLKGKAWLKDQIARRTSIDARLLPYNQELLSWLREQHAQGRKLYLATASHEIFAHQVADFLGIFEGVVASNMSHNLSGAKKASALADIVEGGRFAYAGNAPVDLAVWKASDSAIVVGREKLARSAATVAPVEQHFPTMTASLATLAKALRIHQWVKNALIFIPLLAAHRLFDLGSITAAIIAFFAFSFCASSVYLLNDMLDLAEDRAHPRKCKRPFAAGTLPISTGVLLIPLLLGLAALLAFQLPTHFLWVLCAYYVATFAYSFYVKRIVLIDVVTLSALYTIRIVAGAAAVDVPVSFWMLAFSTFIFLSLAILKRYAELLVMRSRDSKKVPGRGYQVEDLELLSSLGSSSGYLSVLVLALYINSAEIRVLYDLPQIMWPVCLVMLYWVSRVWVIAHRGNMHDDPIVFAIKDRVSIFCGALIAGMMVWAA
jgi:4-hydroxybenzoate polyprenyltransferase